jgi:hypothetical protein
MFARGGLLPTFRRLARQFALQLLPCDFASANFSRLLAALPISKRLAAAVQRSLTITCSRLHLAMRARSRGTTSLI